MVWDSMQLISRKRMEREHRNKATAPLKHSHSTLPVSSTIGNSTALHYSKQSVRENVTLNSAAAENSRTQPATAAGTPQDSYEQRLAQLIERQKLQLRHLYPQLEEEENVAEYSTNSVAVGRIRPNSAAASSSQRSPAMAVRPTTTVRPQSAATNRTSANSGLMHNTANMTNNNISVAEQSRTLLSAVFPPKHVRFASQSTNTTITRPGSAVPFSQRQTDLSAASISQGYSQEEPPPVLQTTSLASHLFATSTQLKKQQVNDRSLTYSNIRGVYPHIPTPVVQQMLDQWEADMDRTLRVFRVVLSLPHLAVKKKHNPFDTEHDALEEDDDNSEGESLDGNENCNDDDVDRTDSDEEDSDSSSSTDSNNKQPGEGKQQKGTATTTASSSTSESNSVSDNFSPTKKRRKKSRRRSARGEKFRRRPVEPEDDISMYLTRTTVQRILNESQLSAHCVQQEDTNLHQMPKKHTGRPSSASMVRSRLPSFSQQNILMDTLSGSSAGRYYLLEQHLRGLSDDDRAVMVAQLGPRARQGVPIKGLAHDLQSVFPIAITCEPLLPSATELPSAGSHSGPVHSDFRFHNRLRILLVGTVRRAAVSGAGEQRAIGHDGNRKGQQILAMQNAGTYNARVVSEQQLRQQARRKREEDRAHSTWLHQQQRQTREDAPPSVTFTPPDWLQASYLTGSSPIPPGEEASLQYSSLMNLSATSWLLTDTKRQRPHPFPGELRDLLAAKYAADAQPLRQHREITQAAARDDVIQHDEFQMVVQHVVVYEVPAVRPVAATNNTSVPINNPPAKPAAPTPKPAASSAGGGGSSFFEANATPPFDTTALTFPVKDIRNREEACCATWSPMTYTQRWRVPISQVASLFPADRSIRQWDTAATVGGGDGGAGKEVPLRTVMDACHRGSMSIDVCNGQGELWYRHSCVFGPPPSFASTFHTL